MEDNNITYLSRIETILDDADYIVRRESMTPDSEVEQLYVALLQDDQERLYLLEIAFLDDIASIGGLDEGEDAPESAVTMIQYHCTFPFLVEPDHRTDVIRVLNFVNQSFPLGAFSLVESTGNIMFRYIYPSVHPAKVQPEVATEIVSMAELSIGRLGPLVGQVSLGAVSARQAMEAIADEGFFGRQTIV